MVNHLVLIMQAPDLPLKLIIQHECLPEAPHKAAFSVAWFWELKRTSTEV